MSNRFVALGVDGNTVWFRDAETGKEYCNNYETVDLLNSLNNRLIDKDADNCHLQYSIDELTGFDRVDYLAYLIIKHYKNTSDREVRTVLDSILDDLDVPLSTRIQYAKRFDNPDGFKYKFTGYHNKFNKMEYLIDNYICECEQGIEDVIEGEKDSYIVKHDIAIKILKDLKRELLG